VTPATRGADLMSALGHSEKSALKVGMPAILLGADIRGLIVRHTA